MRSAAFIRTFNDILELLADILELWADLLELPDPLLEDPDHLFEHLALILEDRLFIRTFPGLLEHRGNLLEDVQPISITSFY